MAAELAWRAAAPAEPEHSADRFQREVCVPDPERLYRLRPGVTGDWIEASPFESRSVRFTVGPEGRRGGEFDSGGDGPRLLVACLGDSSTMGYGVADDDTFVHRLGERLAARHPERRVVVLNFGVFGYTSRQGRVVLEQDVLPRKPDVVVVAFGYNDGYLEAVDEDSRYAAAPSAAWAPVHDVLRRWSRLYRDAWNRMHRRAVLPALAPRVGRADFAENLRAMVRGARGAGAAVVVLDVDLPNAYLRGTTAAVAAELGTAHVDARRLFVEAASGAGTLGVPDPLVGHDGEELTIRWRGLSRPALVWFDLADAQRAWHLLLLHDDGANGDARAGDGIATATMVAPGVACDVELAVTDMGRLETATGAVNHLFYRPLQLAAGEGFDGPVWDEDAWLAGLGACLRDLSAEGPIRRDVGHPSPHGHALLAEALAARIEARLAAR